MVNRAWFYRVVVWFIVDGFYRVRYGSQSMVLQGGGMVHSRWFYTVYYGLRSMVLQGFDIVRSRWFYRVLVWFTVGGFTGFWYGSQ